MAVLHIYRYHLTIRRLALKAHADGHLCGCMICRSPHLAANAHASHIMPMHDAAPVYPLQRLRIQRRAELVSGQPLCIDPLSCILPLRQLAEMSLQQ